MIDIVVPMVGEAVADVKLVRWLVSEGQAVSKGDILFEVDTDKYVVEIEAFADGKIHEILVHADATVVPRQVVARLDPLTDVPQAAQPADVHTGTARTEPGDLPTTIPVPPPRTPDGILATPRARRIAREREVDLASIRGTGPSGRITAADVEAAGAVGAPPHGGTLTRLSPTRAAIAHRMQESKRVVPHFYLTAEVDMTEAQGLRRRTVDELGWSTPPSYTVLVVAACARALAALPATNVSVVDQSMLTRSVVNIGVAVALDEGLVVPVVGGADRLTLENLASTLADVLERARAGRFRETDIDERSIVVSNLGMFGIDSFSAIINPPDPMILSVGRVADRCVAVDGKAEVRPTSILTLSVDHRALDGAPAATFLERVKGMLEQPSDLIETGAA